jgi:hypothetical protein
MRPTTSAHRDQRPFGIVAQVDIARTENEKTGQLVEAISETSEGERRLRDP